MKRLVTSLIALIALGGALIAEPITFEFWHAMTGKNGEITQAVCDKFNASQTQYKIVPVLKGSYPETFNAAIAAFRAKQPPAIVQVQEVMTATFMATKAIYPVYQLMKDQGVKFDANVYIPAIKAYYSTADGKMLSMPFNSSTCVMYYNKEAFVKAGLDPNKPPVTWPEVFEAAKKIKAAGYQGGFTTNWISWIQIENFSAWHNLPIGTNANGMNGKLDTVLQFNNPLEVKHLQNIADLAKQGVFLYGGRESKANSLFQTGQVGIYFESIGGYGSNKANCKFDFGVARLPYYPEAKGAPQNSIIGGASLWVFQGLPKPQYKGVAAFFNFLSQPEIQAFWHQNTGYLPITKAAYELTKSQGFYNTNPAPELALNQLNNKAPTANSSGLRLGNFGQIREVEDQVWEDILAGKIGVKEGLDLMVQKGNALLRDFEKANK